MVSYPGAYGDFVCVTALDPAGKPSCYTNYVSPSGSKNLIAAPGGDANAFKSEKHLFFLQCRIQLLRVPILQQVKVGMVIWMELQWLVRMCRE